MACLGCPGVVSCLVEAHEDSANDRHDRDRVPGTDVACHACRHGMASMTPKRCCGLPSFLPSFLLYRFLCSLIFILFLSVFLSFFLSFGLSFFILSFFLPSFFPSFLVIAALEGLIYIKAIKCLNIKYTIDYRCLYQMQVQDWLAHMSTMSCKPSNRND